MLIRWWQLSTAQKETDNSQQPEQTFTEYSVLFWAAVFWKHHHRTQQTCSLSMPAIKSLLFNLLEVFIFLLKKKLSQRKRRLIQFRYFQKIVLFLINFKCAFTLLDMELHCSCLKKIWRQKSWMDTSSSILKKYLLLMLQWKVKGTFIITRNLAEFEKTTVHFPNFLSIWFWGLKV